jgi:hypothetical protein
VNVMETANVPSIGLFRWTSWVVPIGVVLTVGGILLNALLELYSFKNTQEGEFTVLETIFLPSLLIGTAFVIIDSFLDRRRLSAVQTRRRGILFLAISAVSFVLLAFFGNVHGWTFAFIFPAFGGLVSGINLLG